MLESHDMQTSIEGISRPLLLSGYCSVLSFASAGTAGYPRGAVTLSQTPECFDILSLAEVHVWREIEHYK